MTPILARTLSWFEVANSASIIFDLRVTAVAGEPEAETQGRFVAEAFLWNKGARVLVKPNGMMRSRRDRQQHGPTRRRCEI